MIKNIFLPKKWGSYYLFSSRIIGIEIGITHIHGVQIRASGSKRTIEKIISTPFDISIQENDQRIQNALTKTFDQLDKADSIVTALPSTHCIFKKITVPFSQHEKITQVIGFEVEPLLPFPLSSALIDFIITRTDTEGTNTEVLVAAVQKDTVLKHKALFEQINIDPTIITVDILSLYALTRMIPTYTHTDGNMALITIGTATTSIACIHNGTLSLVRTLTKGTRQIAKMIGVEQKKNSDEVLENLLRFGLEVDDKSQSTTAITNVIHSFCDDIAFTLNSFATEKNKIDTILLLGPGAHIKGIIPFMSEALSIPCQLFNPHLMLDNGKIRMKKNGTLTSEYSIALSAAFPSPLMTDFNLLPKEENTANITLFAKQCIVAIVLSLSILGALGTHFFLQQLTLKKEANTSEQEAVTTLKNQFEDIDSNRLINVVEDAEEALQEKEKTWFAFSSASRASMLSILLELKSKIDKEALGFIIEKLTIIEDTITLKAHVKDHNALKLLEQALRSSTLFAYVEPQTDPHFEMKITLASSTREEL